MISFNTGLMSAVSKIDSTMKQKLYPAVALIVNVA
jgi:hypothetical protein